MTIQTVRRSALTSASTSTAALLVALAWGVADSGTAHATARSAPHRTLLAAADVPAETNAAAPVAANPAPAAADADAATADRSIGPGSGISDGGANAARMTAVAAASPAVIATSDDGSGWDKASLVGKIFIACGTLLTLGSAARMFMA